MSIGFTGKKHSEETKRKMSFIAVGRHHSDETKKKISVSKSDQSSRGKGWHHSEEAKRKMSLAKRGRKNIWRIGKHHSEKTRRKMSENHADFSGENNPHFGKPPSAETRKKISESLTMTNPRARTSWQERARKAWTEAQGPILEGMLIHHIDGNYKNNSLNNLIMITRGEHRKIHNGMKRILEM